MRFEIDKKALAAELELLTGVVERKISVPILQNILFVADADGAVKASATDQDITLISSFEANVLENGRAAIPARILTERIKAMPDGPIALEVEGMLVTISGGRAKSTMGSIPPDDFPIAPKEPEGDPISIGPQLSGLLERTRFAISKDDATHNYNLKGVMLTIAKGQAEAAGLDGNRIVAARCKIEDEKTDRPPLSIFLPGKIT